MSYLCKAAVLWALDEAQDVPARLVSTLLAVARYAGTDGRGAHPSAHTIAQHTRKSPRQAQRDLADLEQLGLLTRGDQRIVAGVPVNKRPVVYDLGGYVTHDVPSAQVDTSPVTARYDTQRHLDTTMVSHKEVQKTSGRRARGDDAAAPPRSLPPNQPLMIAGIAQLPPCEHGMPGGQSANGSGVVRCALCRTAAATS